MMAIAGDNCTRVADGWCTWALAITIKVTPHRASTVGLAPDVFVDVGVNSKKFLEQSLLCGIPNNLPTKG